jgi:hypothetical protein
MTQPQLEELIGHPLIILILTILILILAASQAALNASFPSSNSGIISSGIAALGFIIIGIGVIDAVSVAAFVINLFKSKNSRDSF